MHRAPFPWHGGKRRVADVVWRALGDCPNYVEPFAGSLAVLLGRPGGAGKIETANDLDCNLANFWRAVKFAPEETARWADWPVNEADLHARHAWLVTSIAEDRDRLMTDPDYFNAKRAGWWVWGISQWIGTGWCGEIKRGRPRPNLNAGQGVHAPGVTRPRLPSLGNNKGVHGLSKPPALEWFVALQERLRRVRVVCGDWKRVVTPSVLGKGKNVGGMRPCAVFLDPPYDLGLREDHIYAHDAGGVSAEVRRWAIEHGDDPELRIALCGYEGEHDMPSSWAVHAWKGARGYASAKNTNRERERIWFSPHCLSLEAEQQRAMF